MLIGGIPYAQRKFPCLSAWHTIEMAGVIEGFTNEEKWVTALLSTEGEARMDNDALKPRLKAEVSMEGYHFLSW